MTTTALPEITHTVRTCSTCGHSGPPCDFYNSVSECRICKRERSRLNRIAIADKAAMTDHLLALVERLTGSSMKTAPDHRRANASPGPRNHRTPTVK